MNCTQCGTQNPENAVFCKNCGASLFKQAEEMAENNTAATEPVTNEEPKEENKKEQENYVPVNPVIQLIKKWSTSSLFLTATILFTVCLGLSALTGLFTGSEDGGFSLSVSVTGIIAMVGLWKIYSAGKKSAGEFNKSGLTMLKTIAIIELIISSIALGLGGLALIVVGALMPAVIEYLSDQWYEMINEIQSELNLAEFGLGEFDINMLFSQEFLMTFFIAMGIGLLGALVLCIFFYSKAIKNIGNVISIVETGTVTNNIAMGFIVFMFIFGGISVMSFDLIAICEGAAYILFGIVMLQFRNEAEKLKYVVDYTDRVL